MKVMQGVIKNICVRKSLTDSWFLNGRVETFGLLKDYKYWVRDEVLKMALKTCRQTRVFLKEMAEKVEKRSKKKFDKSLH